ncbi:MAG: DUF167 domain-containing protein [Candidatus Aminicenantaceae bacterium]
MVIGNRIKDRGKVPATVKIYLNVKVYPRSRKQEIVEENSGELKIKVHSPPSKGEANRKVIEIIASHFGLPSSRVKIIRGQKSQRKLISLEVDKSELMRFDNKNIIREGKS